jgi:hypothetical protein
MTIALGLFHFNIQYVAGDRLSYHRYATQAVIPFLQFISMDPRYRISFEMAGSGLEFLADHYPNAIALLRTLIDRGTVELISSTYAPTMWIAFPLRDLRKSIELNKIVLGRLGLSAAPIFFSQEAFFGHGLKEIGDIFPIILCKDDYVSHYRSSILCRSAYRLGTQKVLIGSGHWRDFIQANDTQPLSPKACGNGSEFWYHMGSGHHLVVPAPPTQWAQFFADEARMETSHKYFQRIFDSGMRLGTIMEYASSLDWTEMPPWPLLPEGSWNARISNGVYAWMGKLANPWEADGELLGVVWRARRKVRELEEAICHAPEVLKEGYSEQLLEAWRLLIIAESSDPLGWEPTSGEVLFGRVAGEKALQFATGLATAWSLSGQTSNYGSGGPNQIAPIIPYAHIELVGAIGEIQWLARSVTEQVCEIEFVATDAVAGIKIARSTESCWYSPSGLEAEIHTIDPKQFDCDDIYLPLANGFVSVAEDTHLIRVNDFGQIAACLSKESLALSFTVTGNIPGRSYRWKFVVLRCDVTAAVARANEINCT